eukprot:comp24315_c3_seq1/m.45764 comp24315_c3_seq1/g.45764  ORF comp24315_c3_seq1/g.45764 comp24315_c3_seq1/m.45764 type:complete len:195 (-) comp24315_c3_seq1:60-644(-)
MGVKKKTRRQQPRNMSDVLKEVLTRLEGLGIEAPVHEHPIALTVDEWRPHILSGPDPNVTITKCLFLKDKKDRLYLIVALADTPVDMKHLLKSFKDLYPAHTGMQTLRFANESLLEQTLSIQRGAVTPLALCMDKEKIINVVLDQKLVDLSGKPEGFVCVHPGTNDKTVYLRVEDITRFIEAHHGPYKACSLAP